MNEVKNLDTDPLSYHNLSVRLQAQSNKEGGLYSKI